MASNKPRCWLGPRAKRGIEVRDQFAHQCAGARAIGRAIGEHVVSPLAIAAEKHADEIDFAFGGYGGVAVLERVALAAAESADAKHHRVAPLRSLRVIGRQHDRRAMLNLAM